MNTLQAWIVVGGPALALAAALFAGRSVTRAAAGYLVLALTFVFFLLVPRSSVSAAAIGAVAVLLLAAGRGDLRVESEDALQGVPLRVDDPEVDDPRRM